MFGNSSCLQHVHLLVQTRFVSVFPHRDTAPHFTHHTPHTRPLAHLHTHTPHTPCGCQKHGHRAHATTHSTHTLHATQHTLHTTHRTSRTHTQTPPQHRQNHKQTHRHTQHNDKREPNKLFPCDPQEICDVDESETSSSSFCSTDLRAEKSVAQEPPELLLESPCWLPFPGQQLAAGTRPRLQETSSSR